MAQTKTCDFCSLEVEWKPDRKIERVNGYWICTDCSSAVEVMQLDTKAGEKFGK